MKLPEGWAMPQDARRFHYFKDGKSLCGKWLFESKNKGDYDPGTEQQSTADCEACWKKRKGMKLV